MNFFTFNNNLVQTNTTIIHQESGDQGSNTIPTKYIYMIFVRKLSCKVILKIVWFHSYKSYKARKTTQTYFKNGKLKTCATLSFLISKWNHKYDNKIKYLKKIIFLNVTKFDTYIYTKYSKI